MTAWIATLVVSIAATAALLAASGAVWHLAARVARYRRIARRFPWIARSEAWSLAREVGR